MEYSEKVVSAISQAIVTALKKAISDNSRQVDTKLKNVKITGDNIMPLSIDSAHIKEASIDIAKVKDFSAEVANIAVANIENATIDTAQIRDLAAYVANITVATIETADITWAEIAELSAAVANIAIVEIDRATIKYSQIEGLTAGSALITEMVGGKVGIADLAVTDANIVELNANKINAGTLSVERLVIVGNEKSIVYAINEANGTAQLSQTTIDGGSITRKTITADQIVAQGITAECLNVKEIFANEALIGVITTANLNASEIASNKAFISQLTTSMIASPEFGGLDLASREYVRTEVSKVSKNTTYIQYDEPQGTFLIGDIWIKTNIPNVTWETLSAKTWEEVKTNIWGNWGTSDNPVTHVWDGSQWLVTVDLSDVSEIKTVVEQTSERITQLATRDEMNTLVEQTARDIKANVVYEDKVISAINLSQEEAYILAPRIRLEGLITANGNFIVKEDGSIEAVNAAISGSITAGSGSIGGWEIGKKRLSSGTGENCVVLSTESTVYAIWAGADAGADAPFSVTQKGALRARSGSIAGWTIEEGSLHAGSTADKNYVALSTANETYAIWAGRREAALAPFSVTRGGYLKSTSGLIGGWSIGTDSLYAGSGSNKVALSTNASSEYAIWAGADEAVDAPFIVKKDGTVYVDKIIARTEEDSEIEEPVSLRNDLWKLNRAVEKLEVSDDGKSLCIKLYASKEINFNKASDFEYLHTAAAGSGSNRVTITVKALTELAEELSSQEITATLNVAQKRVTLGAIGTAAHGDFVNCEAIYNAGWNECIEACIPTIKLYRITEDFSDQVLYYSDGSEAGTGFYRIEEVENTFFIPEVV